MSESNRPQDPEQLGASIPAQGAEVSFDPESITLYSAERLGFVETDELREVREQLMDALQSGADGAHELMVRYHELGQEIAEQDLTGNAKIGLIIQMALIRKDTGQHDAALEDVQDAYTFAEGMGIEEVLVDLRAIIDMMTRPELPS